METSTATRSQSVCFAYFGDGKFIGWYADSFGSIRPQSPKVYSSLDSMRETITKNFRYKLAKNPAAQLSLSNSVAEAIVNRSLAKDDTELSQYKVVELRAVACPEYDGPNPDFDEDAYDAQLDSYKAKFDASGIRDLFPGSKERCDAVTAFHAHTPHPKADNWVYADYTKVKAWAANEPTEFIEVITA